MGENSNTENFNEFMAAQKVKPETIDLLIKDGLDDLELVSLIDQNYIKKMKINTGQALALTRAIMQLNAPDEPTSRRAPDEAGQIPTGGPAPSIDASAAPDDSRPTGTAATATSATGDELSAPLSQLKDTGLLGDQARSGHNRGKDKPLLVQDYMHSLSTYTSGQEREVMSLGGDQRLLVSSTRRTSPEHTTLPQWVRGHLRIQEELIDRGELVSIADIKAYAKYGLKIADMCALYPISRVMRFDVEYRVKVYEGALKWGDADPELMNFCIFVQYVNNSDTSKSFKKREVMPFDPSSGKEICRNYNIQKGCQLKHCKFSHVCTKCNQGHPEYRHA